MTVTADYTGRTVDQLLFQGVGAYGKQPVELGWGDAGLLCTGCQKVVQTWAVLFLTERGTVLGDAERGTNFLHAVRVGRIRVDGDVQAEFNMAAERVRRTMDLDAAEAGNLPDDERLDEAVLLDYEIDRLNAKLYLKIRIRTMAGDAREVVLPVPVAIR